MRWELKIDGTAEELDLLQKLTDVVRSSAGRRPELARAADSIKEAVERARVSRAAYDELVVLSSEQAYELLREISDNARVALVLLSRHVVQRGLEDAHLDIARSASEALGLGFTDEEIAAKVGTIEPTGWAEVNIDVFLKDEALMAIDPQTEVSGNTWSGWMSSVGAALKRLGLGKIYVADYNRRTFAMNSETAKALIAVDEHMHREDNVLEELNSPAAAAANAAAMLASDAEAK